MKVNYTFSKDPINLGTVFDLDRTRISDGDERVLILKLSESSKSDKFKELQNDDLLILREDLLNKEQGNIVKVNDVTYLGSTGLYEVRVEGLSKSLDDIDEYDEDTDQFVVLGRVQKEKEI